jgi:leucyl-tRNA synthetase
MVDRAALVRDTLTLAVQINGKLRATIEVATHASKEDAEALALSQPQVMHFLENMTVRKVIVVPGKIVNIVAG